MEYPSNLTPRQSELRPHCAAQDRIALWVPHPGSIATHGPDIPSDACERVCAVTLHAWAPSMKASYTAGLLVYHIFCNCHEIPELEKVPASPALIARFISALAGHYAGQTVQGYVYSVCAWHIVNRLLWSPDEDQITAMLKGAAKLAPPTSKQDLR